jgi:2-polyprenyl-3-methyl-5-hydroxy-6-metoxy-1,4-benzoquinol methylase
MISPQLRNVRTLQRDPNSKLLQPSSVTSPDRYPALFDFVREQLSTVRTPNILSYGCSSGEEVFSLHGYVPNANIKGLDINSVSIKICQKRLARKPLPNLQFVCANSPAGEPSDAYDAIFCMAVLRHGALQADRPDRCDAHIRFADVAALVEDLARCLKPGGFLVVENSQFRFSDMPAASNFDVVYSRLERQTLDYPIYGPDNRRIKEAVYAEKIFRKRQN